MNLFSTHPRSRSVWRGCARCGSPDMTLGRARHQGRGLFARVLVFLVCLLPLGCASTKPTGPPVLRPNPYQAPAYQAVGDAIVASLSGVSVTLRWLDEEGVRGYYAARPGLIFPGRRSSGRRRLDGVPPSNQQPDARGGAVRPGVGGPGSAGRRTSATYPLRGDVHAAAGDRERPGAPPQPAGDALESLCRHFPGRSAGRTAVVCRHRSGSQAPDVGLGLFLRRRSGGPRPLSSSRSSARLFRPQIPQGRHDRYASRRIPGRNRIERNLA